jgi:hypothetical protein
MLHIPLNKQKILNRYTTTILQHFISLSRLNHSPHLSNHVPLKDTPLCPFIPMYNIMQQLTMPSTPILITINQHCGDNWACQEDEREVPVACCMGI